MEPERSHVARGRTANHVRERYGKQTEPLKDEQGTERARGLGTRAILKACGASGGLEFPVGDPDARSDCRGGGADDSHRPGPPGNAGPFGQSEGRARCEQRASGAAGGEGDGLERIAVAANLRELSRIVP